CVYCYGNALKAVGALQGLRDAMIPNQTSGTQLDINTDLVVLTLNSSANSNAVLVLRYATPTLNDPNDGQITNCHSEANCGSPPRCVNARTGAIKIKGIGFGPAGECITSAPTKCPLQGKIAVPGASITFSGGVTGDVKFWSDDGIVVSVPAGATDGP